MKQRLTFLNHQRIKIPVKIEVPPNRLLHGTVESRKNRVVLRFLRLLCLKTIINQ